MEKEGIKQLRDELREKLKSKRRAKYYRKKKKKKEKASQRFINNLYKFTSQLLGKPKGGTLESTMEEVEEHLKQTHSDIFQETELGNCKNLMIPEAPQVKFNMKEPTLVQLTEILRKARSKSAPGYSGTSYKVYKKCPLLLGRLHKLIKVVRKQHAEDSRMLAVCRRLLNTQERNLQTHQTVPHNLTTNCRRQNLFLINVRNTEKEQRHTKAVSMQSQGAWMKWEEVLNKKITWSELWKMEPLRIKFCLRSVYDVLPTPTNLVKWGKTEDPNCKLYGKPCTLQHVLSSCNVALTQGRYTWQHNKSWPQPLIES